MNDHFRYISLENARRIILVITTSVLFELPGLKVLRNRILRCFFRFGPHTRFKMGAKMVLIHPEPSVQQTIAIGDYCEIGVDCMLDYSGGIAIGDEVWISQGVKIFTHTHVIAGRMPKRGMAITYQRLIIEDDAWLGAGSIILPSVGRIGRGAIVGAGAVVTREVCDYAVVAGNPAKIIGSR